MLFCFGCDDSACGVVRSLDIDYGNFHPWIHHPMDFYPITNCTPVLGWLCMCLPYVFDHFDSERHSGVELLILFAQLKAANSQCVPVQCGSLLSSKWEAAEYCWKMDRIPCFRKSASLASYGGWLALNHLSKPSGKNVRISIWIDSFNTLARQKIIEICRTLPAKSPSLADTSK